MCQPLGDGMGSLIGGLGSCKPRVGYTVQCFIPNSQRRPIPIVSTLIALIVARDKVVDLFWDPCIPQQVLKSAVQGVCYLPLGAENA